MSILGISGAGFNDISSGFQEHRGTALGAAASAYTGNPAYFAAGAGYDANRANIAAQQDALDRQYDYARNSFRNRVQDARDMGISPLAAMGMGQPGVSGQSPKMTKQGAISQAISDIFRYNSAQERSALVRAQIAESQARAMALLKDDVYNSNKQRIAENEVIPEQELPTRNVITSGEKKFVTPKDSTQEYWEQNFGGFVAEGAGIKRFGQMMLNNHPVTRGIANMMRAFEKAVEDMDRRIDINEINTILDNSLKKHGKTYRGTIRRQ